MQKKMAGKDKLVVEICKP